MRAHERPTSSQPPRNSDELAIGYGWRDGRRMDARVAQFEHANDLSFEQVYRKLALGRCRNVLHILGEKCGAPQDMYHWGTAGTEAKSGR